MEEISLLIARATAARAARAEKSQAFGEIVRRFQDLAFACAYAVLGDFHLAEDAAQEAFVEAHRELPNLREPAAFGAWLRLIVFKHCDRLTRRKRPPLTGLEAAVTRPDDRARLAPWAEMWERSAAGTFLRAYLEVAENAAFLPTRTADVEALVDAFVLDKALYELNYELNNRPDWVRIPLRGISDLLAAR